MSNDWEIWDTGKECPVEGSPFKSVDQSLSAKMSNKNIFMNICCNLTIILVKISIIFIIKFSI